MNNLNKFGNKPRVPGMPIPPNLQDQYLKETFGLSDEDLKALDKGTYKIPQIATPAPIQKKSTTASSPEVKNKQSKLTLDQLIQQSNEKAKQKGQFNTQPPMPQSSMQVMFFNKKPIYPKKIEK